MKRSEALKEIEDTINFLINETTLHDKSEQKSLAEHILNKIESTGHLKPTYPDTKINYVRHVGWEPE